MATCHSAAERCASGAGSSRSDAGAKAVPRRLQAVVRWGETPADRAPAGPVCLPSARQGLLQGYRHQPSTRPLPPRRTAWSGPLARIRREAGWGVPPCAPPPGCHSMSLWPQHPFQHRRPAFSRAASQRPPLPRGRSPESCGRCCACRQSSYRPVQCRGHGRALKGRSRRTG